MARAGINRSVQMSSPKYNGQLVSLLSCSIQCFCSEIRMFTQFRAPVQIILEIAFEAGVLRRLDE